MSIINIKNDVLDANTLNEVKEYIKTCIHEFKYNEKRICIHIENNNLIKKIFSKIESSDNFILTDIDCFTMNNVTEHDYIYEKQYCKEGDRIFDLQIIQRGKIPLIGNTDSYKESLTLVLIKRLLIKYLKINICNDDKMQFIEAFLSTYNFTDTCFNPEFFAYSILSYIRKENNVQLFISTVKYCEQFFRDFWDAMEKSNNNIYYSSINSTFSNTEFLSEISIEKINSSVGNAYLQIAMPSDPILRNYPLKDNQYISFPGHLIHKRESYENFTDDKIIHILFKCTKNLNK